MPFIFILLYMCVKDKTACAIKTTRDNVRTHFYSCDQAVFDAPLPPSLFRQTAVFALSMSVSFCTIQSTTKKCFAVMGIKQYAKGKSVQPACLKILDTTWNCSSFLLSSRWEVNLTITILRWGNCFEQK